MKDKNMYGGPRAEGHIKRSLPGMPLISVVTVSFNNREGLEETMGSVANQSYDNIEYMVIDGGSCDGSLDVIKEHEGRLDYWISEPDEGIYDAMNKGIRHSTGDWIIFMNCGDVFFSSATLLNAVKKMDESADLIYGSCVYRHEAYGNLLRHIEAGNPDNRWGRMRFSHQSLFAKGGLMREMEFDCTYRYCADYDFVLKAYHDKYKFQKIDETIATVTSGGKSHAGMIEARKEYVTIARKHENNFASCLYYLSFLKAVITVKTKSVIPHKFLCAVYWIRHGQIKGLLKGRK